jgi:kynurenine formamidase
MANKVRLVDLSVEIKEGIGETPPAEKMDPKLIEILSAKIIYEDHRVGTQHMLRVFQGITQEDLPEGLGWSGELLSLASHSGTHMDAPYHYHPTSEGKRAKTIDEVPLEWCYANGVVLNMTHKKTGELIHSVDIREALKKIDYELKPLDIVLVRTDTDKLWDTMRYWTDQPGMSREGTIWLVDHGVKVMGIDAPGWDRPFPYQAAEFLKTKDRSLIWEGHFAGIEREYFQMEKLANLDQLPPFGFKVSCFPIKILKAGAAWVRPVAIIEE